MKRRRRRRRRFDVAAKSPLWPVLCTSLPLVCWKLQHFKQPIQFNPIQTKWNPSQMSNLKRTAPNCVRIHFNQSEIKRQFNWFNRQLSNEEGASPRIGWAECRGEEEGGGLTWKRGKVKKIKSKKLVWFYFRVNREGKKTFHLIVRHCSRFLFRGWFNGEDDEEWGGGFFLP